MFFKSIVCLSVLFNELMWIHVIAFVFDEFQTICCVWLIVVKIGRIVVSWFNIACFVKDGNKKWNMVQVLQGCEKLSRMTCSGVWGTCAIIVHLCIFARLLVFELLLCMYAYLHNGLHLRYCSLSLTSSLTDVVQAKVM